jgi:hypothetical protein
MAKVETTELLIVGAGAAGLMAAVRAGEMGMRAVLLERKHLAGRKLLMCGNARCNITSDLEPEEMIAAYGEPVSDFLEAAIRAFPSRSLQQWLNRNGLPTAVHQDGRVFPASEKASDVLRFFTDTLRRQGMPVMFNAPVSGIDPQEGGGWRIRARHCELHARSVLVATGGVSYPKTGSVGDGQNMASALGHRLVPYRPGLVGYEVQEEWLQQYVDTGFPAARLEIVGSRGRVLAETRGEVRCERWGLTGPAVVNASRIAARKNLADFFFRVNLIPGLSRDDLVARMKESEALRAGDVESFIAEMGIPAIIAPEFVTRNVYFDHRRIKGKAYRNYRQLAEVLQAWELHPVASRSLKEAMVTVGGVALDEISGQTMESKKVAGLYFAGEVMDVDGPTGGFNLHAAFATARLAVEHAARGCAGGRHELPPPSQHGGRRPKRQLRRQR